MAKKADTFCLLSFFKLSEQTAYIYCLECLFDNFTCAPLQKTYITSCPSPTHELLSQLLLLGSLWSKLLFHLTPLWLLNPCGFTPHHRFIAGISKEPRNEIQIYAESRLLYVKWQSWKLWLSCWLAFKEFKICKQLSRGRRVGEDSQEASIHTQEHDILKGQRNLYPADT